jgi:hypothetical protein
MNVVFPANRHGISQFTGYAFDDINHIVFAFGHSAKRFRFRQQAKGINRTCPCPEVLTGKIIFCAGL